VLCTREVQKSISESVHQLLSDWITRLGLNEFFTVQQNYIHGANGSQIAFHGLSGQTATSIKSFEGITICWVEEAQTITKRSWELLEPTIQSARLRIMGELQPRHGHG
jgi:phage terminase large subunit